jgi:hypothetical protein
MASFSEAPRRKTAGPKMHRSHQAVLLTLIAVVLLLATEFAR